MHADRPDVADLPELRKLPGKEPDRLRVIPLRLCQHLVVVTDLVAESLDHPDRLRDEGRGVSEVVGRTDPEVVLEFGHLEGVLRLSVDIVAENHHSPGRGFSEMPVDRRRGVTGTEEHAAEFPVLRHREVPHH